MMIGQKASEFAEKPYQVPMRSRLAKVEEQIEAAKASARQILNQDIRPEDSAKIRRALDSLRQAQDILSDL